MPTVKKEKQLRDLDTARIAKAAMTVIDEHGSGGFTMRAVAQSLGVTPMALYHHVGDKAGLAALLVDQAIREIPLPPPTGEWQEDMWLIANWMRQTTLAHPAVAQLRREFQIWTAAVLQITERWVGLWQQSGLEFDKAVLAARSSSTTITGLVMEELTLRDIKLPEEAELALLPNAKMMFDSPRGNSEEFELAVRALIDGIFTQLSKKPS